MSKRYLFISGALVMLFLAIFVVRIESSRIGPETAEERDDLGITQAYVDPASETLYLVTPERWAQLSLADLRRQNAQFQYTVLPREGNFLHWRSFKDGRLPLDPARLAPAAVRTSTYASLNYKWDGHPRLNHEELSQLPAGYQYALYRSSSEPAGNQHTWFKSYLLQTPAQGVDGRFGVQFFYHPDYRYQLRWQHPAMLVLFGPGFLALCIALPLAFSRVRTGRASLLFALAALLHAGSFLLLWLLVRYGEGWSGYSSEHNTPYVYLAAGGGVLLALYLTWLARGKHKV